MLFKKCEIIKIDIAEVIQICAGAPARGNAIAIQPVRGDIGQRVNIGEQLHRANNKSQNNC
jgi:hypothetical protein